MEPTFISLSAVRPYRRSRGTDPDLSSLELLIHITIFQVLVLTHNVVYIIYKTLNIFQIHQHQWQ